MQRGLTLQEVGARAGIDVSTLSRLESGKRRLALDHLPRVRGSGAHPPRRHLLAADPQGPAGGLHAFKIRVSARRHTPSAELPVHEVQDWMYVLAGRMRLILGDRDFTIDPGEAVEFSTWTPHWFGVVDGPMEAIVIFGPPGERLHLHS